MKTAIYSNRMAKHAPEPRVMLSCRVKGSIIEGIDALSETLDTRRSELIERALEEFIASRQTPAHQVSPELIAALEQIAPKGKRHADVVEVAIREYIERHAKKR